MSSEIKEKAKELLEKAKIGDITTITITRGDYSFNDGIEGAKTLFDILEALALQKQQDIGAIRVNNEITVGPLWNIETKAFREGISKEKILGWSKTL